MCPLGPFLLAHANHKYIYDLHVDVHKVADVASLFRKQCSLEK